MTTGPSRVRAGRARAASRAARDAIGHQACEVEILEPSGLRLLEELGLLGPIRPERFTFSGRSAGTIRSTASTRYLASKS